MAVGMQSAGDGSDKTSARKWVVWGKELGSGAVRVHFVVISVLAGAAGWSVNQALIGGLGPNEVAVGLMQRHAVALLAGFVVLGILTRIWLVVAGAVPANAPSGLVAAVVRLFNSSSGRSAASAGIGSQQVGGVLGANALAGSAPGEVSGKATASAISAEGAVEAASPSASAQSSASDKGGSDGKDSGGGTFLLLFLAAVAVLAFGVVVVAVWDAPVLLAGMAADMERIASITERGALSSRFWASSWTLAYARRFGPRYGLLSILLLVADAVVLHMAPGALTWAQALRMLDS